MAENTYKPLTSIGIVVAIDDVAVKNAYEFGDLGGTPTMIDATPLSSGVKINKLGVQEQDNWQLKYFFQNDAADSDFRFLNAVNTDKNKLHTVKVTMTDGTKFENTGTASNFTSGASVGAMMTATLSVALAGEWTVTNPTA